MKIVFTWTILLSLVAARISVLWFLKSWQPGEASLLTDAVSAMAEGFILLILIYTPVWILTSAWKVRKAIEKAHEPDYDGVRHWLTIYFSPLYPALRYDDIVLLLYQLYTSPQVKPEVKSSDFSQYFISRGQSYFLNFDGKSKMLDRVNSGFLSGKFLDDLQPRDVYRVIATIVRIGTFLLVVTVIVGAIINLIYHLTKRH